MKAYACRCDFGPLIFQNNILTWSSFKILPLKNTGTKWPQYANSCNFNRSYWDLDSKISGEVINMSNIFYEIRCDNFKSCTLHLELLSILF